MFLTFFPPTPPPRWRVWVYRSRGWDDPRPPLCVFKDRSYAGKKVVMISAPLWVGGGGYVTTGVCKYMKSPPVDRWSYMPKGEYYRHILQR